VKPPVSGVTTFVQIKPRRRLGYRLATGDIVAGGIFCIENWSGDLRVTASVRPLLEFLAESDTARFIHQRVDTAGELSHYLSRFAALDSYRVGYLAMHGDRGRVYVGRHDVTLATLAAWARLDESPPTRRRRGWAAGARDRRGASRSGLVHKFAHVQPCGTLAPLRKAGANSAAARTTECRPSRKRAG
jgi:hypothetical protein